MTTITLDEERLVECNISFKAATQMAGWREYAERRLRQALIYDGCLDESITIEEPFEAEDDNGVPLHAWRIQASGWRKKEHVPA